MQEPYQEGASEADTEKQCSGATYEECTNRGAVESQPMRKRCQEQEGTAQKPSSGDGGCGASYHSWVSG